MTEAQRNKSADKQSSEMRDEAKINGMVPDKNKTEASEIEQTRIENRRDADLDDKTPAGDSGPEDADSGEINMDGASDY